MKTKGIFRPELYRRPVPTGELAPRTTFTFGAFSCLHLHHQSAHGYSPAHKKSSINFESSCFMWCRRTEKKSVLWLQEFKELWNELWSESTHFCCVHLVTGIQQSHSCIYSWFQTKEERTHHRGLVLVDHHFFSFRNYAGARDKTENSKAAETSMSSYLRAFGRGRGCGYRVGLSTRCKMRCGPRKVHHKGQLKIRLRGRRGCLLLA